MKFFSYADGTELLRRINKLFDVQLFVCFNNIKDIAFQFYYLC